MLSTHVLLHCLASNCSFFFDVSAVNVNLPLHRVLKFMKFYEVYEDL